jgi:hypothetical protein
MRVETGLIRCHFTSAAIELNWNKECAAMTLDNEALAGVGDRHCLVVCGMHRSGTSALTRMCNLFGADLGRNVAGVGFDNPKGFWENQAVVGIDQEIEAHMGRRWDSISAPPEGWWRQDWAIDLATRAREALVDQFGQSPLFAIKDPRLSRLLPLWLNVLEELEVTAHLVIALRHPSEVAASLFARNGIGKQQAYLLWLWHTLEALDGAPEGRSCLVRYDALLADGFATMERIAGTAGFAWPGGGDPGRPAISAELVPELRHHRVSEIAASGSPDLDQAVKSLWTMLAVAPVAPAGGVSFELRGVALGRLVAQLCGIEAQRTVPVQRSPSHAQLLHQPPLQPANPRKGLSFHCNLCGTPNQWEETPNREQPTCTRCGSSIRQRAIFDLITRTAYGTSMTAAAAPVRKDFRIIGLSDGLAYAPILERLFDYTNTFFDQEPSLDLTAPPAELLGTVDMIVCSEVLEHVLPPVERAFAGLRALLKPGGTALVTVPFTVDSKTIEHYAGARSMAIAERDGKKVVEWIDATGEARTDLSPIFHGGIGATLEMRIFCRDDVLAKLSAAGFAPRICDDEAPAFGIVWQVPWSLPILAPLA